MTLIWKNLFSFLKYYKDHHGTTPGIFLSIVLTLLSALCQMCISKMIPSVTLLSHGNGQMHKTGINLTITLVPKCQKYTQRLAFNLALFAICRFPSSLEMS